MPQPELVRYDADPDVPAENLVCTFGGREPVVSVRPGSVVSTWTRDAFNGTISKPDHLVTTHGDARYFNPQTGPFFVEGAEPGDTLVVHFVSIVPRETWGASTTVPFFGALTSTPQTPTLQQPLLERTWIYSIDQPAGVVRYEARDSNHVIELPLDPMHGTVGVAPALGEVRSSLVPGAWGGNMDTPEMRTGVTCYLGVNVAGALFSLGDGHARQGEGETCGVAVETAMDTVFAIDLIKGVSTPWPRLESDTHLISTGSARPLEDAFRISQVDIITWIAEETGLSQLDAYQLVSQVSEAPLANVVDPNYTAVAKVNKAYLPSLDAYAGAHRRIKELAAAVG